MRTWRGMLALGTMLALAPGSVPAQGVVEGGSTVTTAPLGVPSPGPQLPYTGTRLDSGTYSVFGAPGYYGVAYGHASYGVPRTYTAFASSFGPGYGYGYAPYAYMPGPYGVGLWRPDLVGPGSIERSSFYRTFPVPYRTDVVPPPLGAYAPTFGPPAYQDW